MASFLDGVTQEKAESVASVEQASIAYAYPHLAGCSVGNGTLICFAQTGPETDSLALATMSTSACLQTKLVYFKGAQHWSAMQTSCTLSERHSRMT